MKKVSCFQFPSILDLGMNRPSFLSRRPEKEDRKKKQTMSSLGPSAPQHYARAARFSTPTTDTNALRDKPPALGRCRCCSFAIAGAGRGHSIGHEKSSRSWIRLVGEDGYGIEVESPIPGGEGLTPYRGSVEALKFLDWILLW